MAPSCIRANWRASILDRYLEDERYRTHLQYHHTKSTRMWPNCERIKNKHASLLNQNVNIGNAGTTWTNQHQVERFRRQGSRDSTQSQTSNSQRQDWSVWQDWTEGRHQTDAEDFSKASDWKTRTLGLNVFEIETQLRETESVIWTSTPRLERCHVWIWLWYQSRTLYISSLKF